MQAVMVSLSTLAGWQVWLGSTGRSILPSKTLVGKHSLMTEVSRSDLRQE